MKRNRVLLLVLLLIMSIFVLTGCTTTVDLDKYVKINAAGYNTQGKVEYSFDVDAFRQDYGNKIKIKSNDKELESLRALYGISPVDAFVNLCINYSVDKSEDLSNGDKVVFKWNCKDADAEKHFGVKLKYSDIEYTVSGLAEVELFDPFEHIDVSYEGISPLGKIVIKPDVNIPEMQTLSFSAKDSIWLENGEEVTITAKAVSEDAFMEKFGKLISPIEKTYVVEGLPHYIREISEIPDKTLKEMTEKVQAKFDKSCDYGSLGAKGLPVKSIEFIGNYILTPNEGANVGNGNFLYFVYKVTCEYKNEDFVFYWYGNYQDVYVNSDGSCDMNLDRFDYCQTTDSDYWGYREVHLEIEEKIFMAGFKTIKEFEEFIFKNKVGNGGWSFKTTVDDSLRH